MNRIVFLYLFFLPFIICTDHIGASPFEIYSPLSKLSETDTLKKNQDLYNGRMWTNRYHRINGDQFLFSNYFLPGTVSCNGKTYKNLLIRYDIYSDEIMIPVNRDEILQLNKEMVDSFTLSFENREYIFTKIRDTLTIHIGFNGYVNVLYKQKSSLFIKYMKAISPNITDKSDGTFLQTQKVYLVKDGIVNPIATNNDLYKALNANIEQVKNYIKINKIKVTKNKPESFIPLIKYYDIAGH